MFKVHLQVWGVLRGFGVILTVNITSYNYFMYLSNMSESTAALSTHPMSGTPANILMFFRGIPLLPPLARIKAATCLLPPARICLQAGSSPSCPPLPPGRLLFLEDMPTLKTQRFVQKTMRAAVTPTPWCYRRNVAVHVRIAARRAGVLYECVPDSSSSGL